MSLSTYFALLVMILTCQVSAQERTRIFDQRFPAAGFSLSLYRLPDGELPERRGPRYVYEFMLQRNEGHELALARLNSANPYFPPASPFRPISVQDVNQANDGSTGILVHGSGTQEYFHLLFNSRDDTPAARVSRLDVWNEVMKDENAICRLETPERVIATSSNGKQQHSLVRQTSGRWTFDGVLIQSSFGFTRKGLPDWPESVIKQYLEGAAAAAAAKKGGMPASSASESGLQGLSVPSATTKRQPIKPVNAGEPPVEEGTGIGMILGLSLAGALLAWGLLRFFGKQNSQHRSR